MISVTVNGESREFSHEISIAELLNNLGYRRESIAAAVNGEFVPRKMFDTTSVKDGDTLEIVAPIQGG